MATDRFRWRQPRRRYSDADFAGDKKRQRSTSGVFLALYGAHTFFPLSAQSKKQTAVSHSTVEAEIIAADHAIRMAGLPALPLMGDYPWATSRLGRLSGQPSHGPYYDNGSCADASAHQEDTPGVGRVAP